MSVSNVQLQNIAEYVRAYILRTAQTFGHQNALNRANARWTHTLSVVQNLNLILTRENASADIADVCRVAALFHDIDHYTVQVEYHAARGAETAARYLTKEGYPKEFASRVAFAVREHDRDLNDDISIDEQVQELVDTLPLEARMVLDADTLDKIGVSNILQAVLSMGMTKQPIAEAAKELTSGWPVQRARLWLALLTTPTGQALGAERFKFYQQFLDQIEVEIVMDDPYSQSTRTQEMARV